MNIHTKIDRERGEFKICLGWYIFGAMIPIIVLLALTRYYTP